MSEGHVLTVLALLVSIIVSCVALLVSASETEHLRVQAVERGYALYCPTTGEFSWKGECDD